MTALNLSDSRVRALKIATALCVLIASPCFAQESIPPVPDLEIPYFFDDFDYPSSATAPDPPSDPFKFPYPEGNVFGDNLWFTAAGPDRDLTLERSRGWYEYDWLEYPGNGHIWGYNGPPGDRSWFDPAGVYLSGELDTVLASYNGIRDLFRIADARVPNFLLFRGERGTYQDYTASLRISSGLVADTGTWTARVLLPDFDGLRQHDDVDGERADISLIPAFWLQSSEMFLEEREPVSPTPGDLGDSTRAHQAWSEANYEFNNWYNPDHDNGHKTISAGLTWANPYWSAATENPPLGTSGGAGTCYVRNDDRRDPGRIERSTRECFEILTGKTHGPLFITLSIVISSSDTKYFVFAWDEDLDHRRAGTGTRGYYEDFDYFLMTSIEEVRQFAPPRLMRILFDLNIDANGRQTLPEKKDMVIDWVFYTPAVLGSESSPRIWEVPRLVSRIRSHLWSAYNATHAPVWRVNATGRATARPLYQPVPQTSNPCHNSDRWSRFGMEVEIREFRLGDRIFMSPVTISDADRNSASGVGFHSVTWTLHRWVEGRGKLRVSVPKNQGYILELPDLPADRWEIGVEVQPVGLHPEHEACTEEPARDFHVIVSQ